MVTSKGPCPVPHNTWSHTQEPIKHLTSEYPNSIFPPHGKVVRSMHSLTNDTGRAHTRATRSIIIHTTIPNLLCSQHNPPKNIIKLPLGQPTAQHHVKCTCCSSAAVQYDTAHPYCTACEQYSQEKKCHLLCLKPHSVTLRLAYTVPVPKCPRHPPYHV